MNILSTLQRSVNKSCVTICAAIALLSVSPVSAQRSNDAPAAHFVVKDMRGDNRATVLRTAAQGVEHSPIIVLFGANRNVLDRVRQAAAHAEQAGYGVRAILVGPTNVPPSLEIYASTRTLGPSNERLGAFANAWKVTQPINPYEITANDLQSLIRDIHRQYYPVN